MHQDCINIISKEHITAKIKIQACSTGWPQETEVAFLPHSVIDVQRAHTKGCGVGQHMLVKLGLSWQV